MRVAITGSSGLIGGALRSAFAERGWTVTRITRRRPTAADGEVHWDPARGEIDADGLERHDAIVHLAGESLFGLWTGSKKRRILDSRRDGTLLLSRALASLDSKPAVLISASGVNFYGDRPPSVVVTEETPSGQGFLAEVCRQWEAATEPAESAGLRVVHLRTAVVLSSEGGVLAVMLPIFRLGLGASFGSGRQMYPWVTLADHVRALFHVLERPAFRGPVNLASPGIVNNAEFTRVLARVAGRRAIFRIPAWLLRLAPGGMADELLLPGARVEPRRLLDGGFEFDDPDLEDALRGMLR